MNETENKYTVNRAETLAREFLTRRPELVIHPFDGSDLDLVVTLYPSASLKIQGFSPFGVVVWGTNKSVSSETAASSLATLHLKSLGDHTQRSHTYFLPVLALLYPVRENVGYYAWISEPHFPNDGLPKLIPNEHLDCTPIMRNSLDDIVQKIAEWYTRLAPVLVCA
jgi:hypothetical protein